MFLNRFWPLEQLSVAALITFNIIHGSLKELLFPNIFILVNVFGASTHIVVAYFEIETCNVA